MKFLPIHGTDKLDRVDAKRQLRANRILHTMLLRGPISKYDLSKVLRSTPPSVAETVVELERLGFIRQIGRGPSSGGRKPILYDLVANSAYVLGIDFGRSRTAMVLCNLATEVVARDEGPTLKDEPAEVVIERVKPRIDKLLASVRGSRKRLRGIGFGAPGLIDELPEGIFSRDKRFRALRAELENDLKVPTFLDNDGRTQALAELWFGQGRGRRNFIVLNIGHGIGLGIIANGQLLYGSKAHSGEVGHMRVLWDEKDLSDADRTLEAIAGGWGLSQRAKRVAGAKPGGPLAKLAGESDHGMTARVVVEAAKVGDADAVQLLREAGTAVGRVIGGAVNLLNPELVIIGGRVSQAGTLLSDPLTEAIRETTMPPLWEETEVVVTDIAEDSGPLGASALVFQRIFATDAAELEILI